MNLARPGRRASGGSPAGTAGSGSRTWPRPSIARRGSWRSATSSSPAGFRNDLDALAELCQARGSRALRRRHPGARAPDRIDVRQTPIDFLAADGHKWLLGPEGAGFLFVRARLDRPAPADRRGLAQRRRLVQRSPAPEFRLKPNAQRWEGGSFNMPGLLTFGASLDLFLEWGLEAVVAADPRPRRGRPRGGGLGRMVGPRLARARPTARRSWSWSGRGRPGRRGRRAAAQPRRRRRLPPRPPAHQPARLQRRLGSLR